MRSAPGLARRDTPLHNSGEALECKQATKLVADLSAGLRALAAGPRER